ncbi:prefoldin alpha subunit [Caldisphaera lagunensis DSM 15908]|uniref:Prefoldin alpha subunit n=1 Tax=Caldisphaera lagunensis (strain DSM 15908 / JCM 11604 / ANMR 0165 / IC-154) TaxID=1056495 RepID=L0AAS0_CALLD|nr:PUA domain-containing protein [Caldisphaera lagunensis]AFZ70981.1 prefoldin alpha subunit [Caldisphaera lagunensis DSM 15908]
MKIIEPDEDQIRIIRSILSYQFDERVAEAFIKLPLKISMRLGKIRYVYLNGNRIMTLRPTDFGFTLSIEAGKIILENSDYPKYRVVVRDDVEYMGDVMGIDVIDSDQSIKPGDEVVIISNKGEIIGIGKAKVPGFMMKSMGKGEVVRFRKVLRNEKKS